ncbi:MAG: hypothetical protein AB7V27_00985 [Candidatus Binatia bacterium]
MTEVPYVVQKVDWFQFRDPDGHAFFVMVSSLPNGFYTAVPVDLSMARLDHSKMGLAASPDEALAQLTRALEGKKRDELFPPAA